jgi:organic radical activating enzyme
MNSLFLFVTSRCNSRCRTCFYFDKLNSRDDLSFDQIRRISETAPRFKKLWLSGGEPTLRGELGEIVGLFARNNGIENVNLPTNGLIPDRVFVGVTHSCFIQDSSKFSPRVQLFHIPAAWLGGRFEKLSGAPLDEIERFGALELAWGWRTAARATA